MRPASAHGSRDSSQENKGTPAWPSLSQPSHANDRGSVDRYTSILFGLRCTEPRHWTSFGARGLTLVKRYRHCLCVLELNAGPLQQPRVELLAHVHVAMRLAAPTLKLARVTAQCPARTGSIVVVFWAFDSPRKTNTSSKTVEKFGAHRPRMRQPLWSFSKRPQRDGPMLAGGPAVHASTQDRPVWHLANRT